MTAPEQPAADGSEGVAPGGAEGDPRSTAWSRVRLLGTVTVVVLALDAVLLAWTEMAWLTLRVGTTAIPLPFAAVVALVTTPVLVLAADVALPGTRAPLAPLAVWTLTIVVAGLWSPAGAGVLPPDWRAILLLAAGVLPGALALSWTTTRRRVVARRE